PPAHGKPLNPLREASSQHFPAKGANLLTISKLSTQTRPFGVFGIRNMFYFSAKYIKKNPLLQRLTA
ncbi:MAG: hypothetical protein K2I43_00390, partial [Alistipes sp.]|nr:hypothetical protein [Alistipes sp.]